MYVPINFKNEHWVCGEIDLTEWCITVYDSSESYTTDFLVFSCAMSPYLMGVPLLLRASRYWDETSRSMRVDPLRLVRRVDVPQQRPGSGDCGVFTMVFAYCLSRGASFDSIGDDGMHLRREIAVRLFHQGC